MKIVRRPRWRATALVVGLAGAVAAGSVLPGLAAPIPGAAGCPSFPADSFWHADVSQLPIHPQSASWVAGVGSTSRLKADFGSGTWDGGPIGIPFTTVAGSQPRVPVAFEYDDESDLGPYPIPPDAPIEGGPAATGDRHVLVVDRDACRLWELYSAYPQAGGASWSAGSGATWDLRSNAMRPLAWTSGDAAGLPILPGLVRRNEVVAGEIDHAIRFTAPRTANAYVWPASHRAGTGGPSDPPMGAWFRLKADVDISGFSAANQVILRAMKKHGMVLADNGSPWFLSGAPDPGWDDSDLNLLRSITGPAFEAVDVSSLMVAPTSYAVSQPGPTTTTTTTTTTTAPAPNLVANPGFEASPSGWVAGNGRTTLARTCTVAHTGACSAELGRSLSTGEAALVDAPATVASSAAGATYSASAWVQAPAGRPVTLRVRELSGGGVVRARTTRAMGTGGWQRLSVTSWPAAGATSISVDVIASLRSTGRARVDDISLRRT